MLMISDNAWKEIKEILPTKKTKVGRPPHDAQTILSGIFYVIATGVQWHKLPDYYGKPTTVHGRFRQWIKVGLFDLILKKSIDVAIQHLEKPKAFLIDTSSAKAPFARFGGKNPTDRAKNGVKIKQFLDTPKVMAADSAWDVQKLRSKMAKTNVALFASTNARRNESKQKIRPKGRWKVEQIFGIQQWYRGIKTCWTKTKESFLAFCQFASAIHNFKL